MSGRRDIRREVPWTGQRSCVVAMMTKPAIPGPAPVMTYFLTAWGFTTPEEGTLMQRNQIDVRAHETAERLLRHHRRELVLGDRVTPRWIEDGARFWYAVNTADGKRFVLVDPKTGTRKLAFDHDRLAVALAAASGAGRGRGQPALPGHPTDHGDRPVRCVRRALGGCAWPTTWCGGPPATPRAIHLRSPPRTASTPSTGPATICGCVPWTAPRIGRSPAMAPRTPTMAPTPDYLMYSTLLAKLGLPHLPARGGLGAGLHPDTDPPHRSARCPAHPSVARRARRRR